MKAKLIKKRNELLQKVANLICIMLENARNDREFDYWMWQGLNLNYWCVERGIYLD
jgi:hypothetical protein